MKSKKEFYTYSELSKKAKKVADKVCREWANEIKEMNVTERDKFILDLKDCNAVFNIDGTLY